MTSVVLYFQVHQPYRLRRFTYFDVGVSHDYFDDAENERILKRVAERCYLPMNELLLRAIRETEGEFACAFSLSGTVLRQLEAWAPETLDSFRRLAETGRVEFLCETGMHSLAALTDPAEFERQVAEHRVAIEELSGVKPTSFRNTELVLDEEIARRVEGLGFDVMLGEGADRLLGWRSPHLVYRPRGCERLKLMLRSYELSDDIAFRFSDTAWDEHPLLVEAFAKKLDATPLEAPFIGLFMDYETFGEHQAADTGIFDFMQLLPAQVLENPRLDFATPSEVARRHEPALELAIPSHVSWADAERGLSAWLGNHMQRAAHAALYDLGDAVRSSGSADLIQAWRRLSTSDHVYYMATKFAGAPADGDVHEYFSPYESPHDAFITFMNVIEDLAWRVRRAGVDGSSAPQQDTDT